MAPLSRLYFFRRYLRRCA